MMIIIRLAIAFVIVYFAGVGIVGMIALALKQEELLPGKRFLIPITGYCVSQLLFWWGYVWFEHSWTAFAVAFGVPLFTNIVSTYLRRGKLRKKLILPFSTWSFPAKETLLLVISIGLLVMLSLWPYLLLGEGNYYHSGNLDIFHRLNGSLEYVKNQPLEKMHPTVAISYPLQYSSQAFWMLGLMLRNPMDGCMLQSALNLVLTMLGIYWLLRYVFRLSLAVSLGSGAGSVLANFYFNTYLAGHIGSMMYSSVTPYFLGICVLWIQHVHQATHLAAKNSLRQFMMPFVGLAHLHGLLGLPILFYIVTRYTYAGPINFLIIPLLVFGCHELILIPLNVRKKLAAFYRKPDAASLFKSFRMGKIVFTGVLVGGASTGFIMWMWNYFAFLRLISMYRTPIEPWLIALRREILMIFWGMFPSDLVGSRSLYPFFIKNRLLYTAAFMFSLLFCIITLYGVFVLFRKHSQFFGIFVMFWGAFLIMMKYFIMINYFLHKFYALNFFLVVIGFSTGIAALYQFRRIGKLLVTLSVLSFLIPNIYYNFWQQVNILNRAYHKVEDIAEMEARVANLSNVTIDNSNKLYSTIFSAILRYHGIDEIVVSEKAAYLLKIKNFQDVVDTTNTGAKEIWQNRSFSISTVPDSNIITIHSQYSPDQTPDGPVRWIPNDAINEETLNVIERHILQIPTEWLAQTYFDINRRHIRNAIEFVCQRNGLRFKRSPDNAKYFLRPVNEVKDLSYFVYHPANGEKSVWSDDCFKLIQLPWEGRKRQNKGMLNVIERYILQIPSEWLAQTYFDVGNRESIRDAIEFICQRNGLRFKRSPDNAKYFLRPRNKADRFEDVKDWSYSIYQPMIGEKVVWSSDYFKLIQLPWKDRKRQEEKRRQPLRVNPEFLITVEKRDDSADYLNMILAPGPSTGMTPFTLVVEDHFDGYEFGRYEIEGMSFLSIPASLLGHLTHPLSFSGMGLRGRSLMPLDSRILSIKLLYVEFSSENTLSEDALSILNRLRGNLRDIVSKETRKAGVYLGGGWYEYEEYAGEAFRWIGKQVALIVNEAQNQEIQLLLDIEPGYSSQGNLTLEVVNSEGHIVQTIHITGLRQQISLTLPLNSSQKQQIFWLKAHSQNLPIPDDARILNFRVFSIRLKPTGVQKQPSAAS